MAKIVKAYAREVCRSEGCRADLQEVPAMHRRAYCRREQPKESEERIEHEPSFYHFAVALQPLASYPQTENQGQYAFWRHTWVSYGATDEWSYINC